MDGFAQAHLISQYPIEVIVVEGDKPLKANKLIVFKLSALKYGWLLLDFLLDGVGEVIVYFVGVIEGRLKGFFSDKLVPVLRLIVLIVVLRCAFLNEHLCA